MRKLLLNLLFVLLSVSLVNAEEQAQTFANLDEKHDSENIQSNTKKVELKEAFRIIENNYNVNLIYEGGVVDQKLVEFNAEAIKDKKVENLLNKILTPLRLEYIKIDTKNYSIFKKREKKASKDQLKSVGQNDLTLTAVSTENITTDKLESGIARIVKGRVVDAAGLPMPAVSINIRGTSQGTTTGPEGNFELEIPDEATVLVFRMIGFKDREVTVTSSNSANLLITLLEDAKVLKEVVVTGYQSFSKEHATGSYSTISAEQIEKRRMVSLSQLLEGQVPGLVNYKGDISIRGTSTFRALKSPLYVIDGFPVEKTTINNTGTLDESTPEINPEDIESITVLKDAAAASIYGSRAANGVIVITTKRAKAGEARVNFSSTVSMRSKPDFSYLNSASANTMIGLEEEYAANHPQLLAGTASAAAEALRIRDAVPPHAALNILLNKYAGVISPDEAAIQLNALRNGGNPYQQDVYNYAQQSPIQQQYNLSVAKGTATNSFNFSATYWNNQNTSINDKDNRLAISLNNSLNVSKWLKADVGAYVSYGNEKDLTNSVSGTSMSTSQFPYEKLVDENGNHLFRMNTFDKATNDNIKNYNLYSLNYSSLDEINYNIGNVSNLNTRLFGKLNAQVVPWLNYDLMFQYETINSNTKTINEWDSYDTRYLINSYAVYDATLAKVVYKLPAGDIYNKKNQLSNSYTLRNQFNIKKKFGLVHDMNMILGSEIRQTKNERNISTAYGYNQDLLSSQPINLLELTKAYAGLMRKSVGLGTGALYSNAEVLNRFSSFFANGTYTFADRYSVTGSARMDLSNLFGTNPSYQYRPIWSAGVSWLINKEKFFNVAWVDYLKLRASYGFSGNIAKDAAPYLIGNYSLNSYTLQEVGTIVTPPNPNLRWEKTQTINLGVDFVLLKDKLHGSVEVYRKKSFDLLDQVSIDPVLGYTSALINNGQLLNKGIELSLGSDLLNKRNFKWDVNVNVAYNHNEVVKVDYLPKTASELFASAYLVGNPLQGLYTYKYAGLNDQGNPLIYNEKGEVIYAQVNSPEAVNYAGSLVPLVSGSLTNNITYKGFELSSMVIFNAGQKMRRDVPTITSSYPSMTNNQIDNRWRQAGDELITDIPRYTFHYETTGNNFRNTNYKYADVHILDASYIKLRNIALNYSLPKGLLSKYGVSSTKLRFMVENPVSYNFNNYGIEVEAYNQASGSRSLKAKPTFVLGINVGI